MKWEITKSGFTEPVIIQADSFDEALEKARQIDKGYCGGRVVDD